MMKRGSRTLFANTSSNRNITQYNAIHKETKYGTYRLFFTQEEQKKYSR